MSLQKTIPCFINISSLDEHIMNYAPVGGLDLKDKLLIHSTSFTLQGMNKTTSGTD